MSYGHIKEASRLPGLPRRQVPAPGVCPPWPLTPSALGEPGQAGALQKEESEGAILVGWRGWDLGSNSTSFHVFAALPWAGDPASLSLSFLICKMVLSIPHSGSVGGS